MIVNPRTGETFEIVGFDFPICRVATYFNCSETTARAWCRAGILPAEKIRRRWRVESTAFGNFDEFKWWEFRLSAEKAAFFGFNTHINRGFRRMTGIKEYLR